MNKINEKLNNHERTLITAVISAFRSINPSQNNAYAWYTEKKPLKSSVSPISKPIISTYYVPIFGSVFGSVFASALAFVMIITSSQNNHSANTIEEVSFQTETMSLTSENQDISSFSDISNETSIQKIEESHVLAKIDAQTKAISRTQADESFTESLNVETSLKDLFE